MTIWDAPQNYAPHSLPGTERHYHAGFLARGAGWVTVEIASNGVPTQVEIRRLPDGAVQTRRKLLPATESLELAVQPGPRHQAVSPDGQWLAVSRTLDRKTPLQVYALDTGKFVVELPEAGFGTMCGLDVSPDSRWLVRLDCGSGENAIAIYDTTNWRRTREIRFRSAGEDVMGSAIDPASRFLATGGANENSLRVWDLLTGRMVGQCSGSTVGSQPVWSQDGRALLVREGPNLRLWSMIVFRELAAFPVAWNNTQIPLGFTADDRALVALSSEGQMKAWSPPTLGEIDGKR